MPAAAPSPTTAVIGGGFSGLLTAIHLLEREPRMVVRLVERASHIGRGRAYGGQGGEPLLNVRASNMSAFPDRPEHFRDWLAQAPGDGGADGFVSRRRYGDYLQSLLRDALKRPGRPGRLLLEQDEAVAVVPRPGGYQVRMAMGRTFEADAVVLAVGLGPPAPPAGATAAALASPAFVADPWAADLSTLPDGDILLLGSGLTMIDVALALAGRGEDRRLTALSRRGLLPRSHASAEPARLARGPLNTAGAATRTLRRHADQVGWRGAVDSIRPLTPVIWREWSLAERRRFLRHLLPWWDVHRHRMAPAVAAAIGGLQRDGALEVSAGRLLGLDVREDRLEALVLPRGARTAVRRTYRAAVNCTGLTGDLAHSRLLADLADRGLARPDPLGLGLDLDDRFRLLAADGEVVRGLYAVGPLTRATRWETLAVPDLRGQTAEVTATLAVDLGLSARGLGEAAWSRA